ncbi:MAG TPA: hypothetical protein VGD38_20355 [Pyrinomonadaceae bacterium]
MRKQISERIAKLIEDYPATSDDSPELQKLVAQEKVLPLCCDMGGVLAINAELEIRSFLWDNTLHGQIEHDPRIRNVALFQGSKKYPELELLIEKPNDARVCEYCEGTGVDPYAKKLETDAIVCYCGGLGWLP